MGVFDKITNALLGDLGEGKAKKLEDASDQSTDEQSLASFVKKRVEDVRAQANRVSHEGIWMTNIAYLLGFDSVYYDTTQKQYKPLDKASAYLKRNRLHSNQILPAVQNRLARLCKQAPKYDVRPNSNSEEDRQGARLGIDVINEHWDKQRINKKRITLGMWLQQCGHAYLKVSFDDQLGEPLVDPMTGEALGMEGEVRVDVVSAFEIFVDPLAKDLDEAGWLVHAKVRKLDYFRTHYPERGSLVKAEGAWLLSSQYEMRINSLNSTGPTAGSSVQSQMENAAIELAYYEKPSRKHRHGRMIVVANGILLDNKELPVGKIPYVKFDDILIGGKFFSESTITHARPLQDQYNNVLVKRKKWVDTMLAGKYLAEKRHGLAQESLNDQSGEVVEFNTVPGVNPPTAMQVPSIPQYAYMEGDKLKSDMYEIFGLSEVSRGQLPAAGIPAIGMQLLLEQDETRIGIETEQHEHGYAEVGQLILMYCGEFYKTKRRLKQKKGSDYSVKDYAGEDLKGNYDATVIRGSSVPSSKSMRRQEILNAYQGGLLGNPQDPVLRQKVLYMLEYGDVSEMWRSQALDEAQIQRDIKDLEQELPCEVNEYDNHALHITIKNDFRKTDKFVFEWSDVAKQMLVDNMNQHASEQAKLMNPALNSPPPGLDLDGSQAPTPMDALAEMPPVPQNGIAMPPGLGGMNGPIQ